MGAQFKPVVCAAMIACFCAESSRGLALAQDTNSMMQEFNARQNAFWLQQCSYAPFIPANFPYGLISLTVKNRRGDPYNTIVGEIRGRCLPGNHKKHMICGVSAIRGPNGFISSAQTFYGIYDVQAPKFNLTATGEAAISNCLTNVYGRLGN